MSVLFFILFLWELRQSKSISYSDEIQIGQILKMHRVLRYIHISHVDI